MAAGPKLIFAEFAVKAESMAKTAEMFDFALGHAPGCDLIEFDDWRAVSEQVTKILLASKELAVLSKRLSDNAPFGTAEEIKAARYG